MEENLLNIQQETFGGVVILSLKGPIDSTTYEPFRLAMNAACNGATRVLLDCSGLTYMNSKSLGLLSSYHRQLAMKTGRMALFGLNRKIVKTMDLLGLGQMLKLYDFREQALAEMK